MTAFVLINNHAVKIDADDMDEASFISLTKQVSQLGEQKTAQLPSAPQINNSVIQTVLTLNDDMDEELKNFQSSAPSSPSVDKTTPVLDDDETTLDALFAYSDTCPSPSDDKSSTVYTQNILPDETNIIPSNDSTDDVILSDDGLTVEDDIEAYILDSGYIENTNLWRRWIMAQMLRHYNKADGTSGFDEYFVTGTPYNYEWKVVINEVKVLRHLRGDALAERERFFNKDVIADMAKEYLKKITYRIERSKKLNNDLYKYSSEKDKPRCQFIRLKGYNKRIYIRDDALLTIPEKKNHSAISLSELSTQINKFILQIENAKTYGHLYRILQKFIKTCPILASFAKSAPWKNAFKGSGAYYTMDNMIKFHNCVFHNDDGTTLSMSESLTYLNQKTNEFRNEYYKLYALMRKFISDNNFKYESIPVDNYNLLTYDD